MNRIKFTNFIFMRMFPLCLPVYLFLIVADFISLSSISHKVNHNMVAFEGIVPHTNMEIIFAVSFVLCLCVIPLVFFSFFYKSKSFYTLMQVQPGKNSVYNSFFISGIINLLGLWLAQIIAIFLCYISYSSGPYKDSNAFPNGLFESIVRLDFFKMFFPFSLTEWAMVAFFIVSSILAVIFVIAVIMKNEYKKFIFIALWGLVLIRYFAGLRLYSYFYFWDFVALVIAVITPFYFFIKGRYVISERDVI